MKENNENKKNVPSFEKKNGKNCKKKKSTKDAKVKSKISKIILIIVIILIILAIGIGIYKLVTNKLNKTNVNYLSNMKAYGFDVMYDNQTAEPTDSVTKSEAVKMVMTTMLNETDILKLIEVREFVEDYQDTMTIEQVEQKLEYKNKLWIEYAIDMGVIQEGEITKDNANSNASFLETLVYFANAKTKLLNEVLDTDKKPDIKNFDSYRVSEQLAMRDMINSGIIENKEHKWKENITKEVLNKLIIDMVLKYNTITVEGEKININKDKEPSNAKEYAYTLASVDKKIYELENYIANKEKYQNAKVSYAKMKGHYYAINTLIQDYMNTILNVDYQTINHHFMEKILEISFHNENEKNIKEYMDYVKKNEIKISGSAKVQYPAIYFDGENYRARVKLEYKIENAKEKVNLIYGDLLAKENITYDKDENSMIVDISLEKAITNDLFYINMRALKNIEAGNVKADEESRKEEVENISDESVPSTDNFIPTESEITEDGDTLVVTPK